jgi:hypothetical protein
MTSGLVLLVGGAAAGMFGSLLGLGGGLLLVPLLTFGYGVPLREAVAISLVSVIVTSSAGASVYLRRHVANLRLGMVLELFTAMGALAGGLIAFAIYWPCSPGCSPSCSAGWQSRWPAGDGAAELCWLQVGDGRRGLPINRRRARPTR